MCVRELGVFGECAGHCIGSAAGFCTVPLDVWVGLFRVCTFMRQLQPHVAVAPRHRGHTICVPLSSCLHDFVFASPLKGVDTERVDESDDSGGGEFITYAVLHLSAAPTVAQTEGSSLWHWNAQWIAPVVIYPGTNCNYSGKVLKSRLIASGLKVWVQPCQDTNYPNAIIIKRLHYFIVIRFHMGMFAEVRHPRPIH